MAPGLTDASGAFRFEGVSAEEQKVFAQKKGLLQAEVSARGGQTGVELRMENAAFLSGSVRTTAGELVASFTVRATALDGGEENQHHAVEKSVDGGFALDVFPGEYELSVEAPPLAQQQPLKVTAPSSGIVVVLEPGATIRGRVYDFDAAPAAGVEIRAKQDGPNGARAKGKTDEQGRFELAGLSPGSWTIEALKREKYMVQWRASGQVTLAKAGVAEVTLRPTDGAPFAGVVLSADGEPVAGAEVMAWQRSKGDDEDGPPRMGSAITDERGRFRIRSLEAGPVMVDVRKEKQRLENHPELTAPDPNVILKLGVGTTVSGRVVDPNGKPITSFKVLHDEVESADGHFKIAVDVQEDQIAFDAPGFAQLIRKVKLVKGDNPLGDVVMQRGRPVTGVVRDARTKAPIAGALVDVGVEAPAGNTYFLSEELGAVRTDAQGKYKLPAVDPSSTYILATAEKHVHAAQPLQGNTADFELKPAGSLLVKIIDANGAPVRRAYPRARDSKQNLVPLMPDFAHEGTFKSSELEPGEWTIAVQTEGGLTFRPQTVTIGETQVEVVMHEATDGVTVEVKLADKTDSSLLVPGTMTSVDQVKSLTDFVELKNGVGRNVLPGQWTVVLFRGFRGTTPEASLSHIEVKASNAPFTITPQWQALPRTP